MSKDDSDALNQIVAAFSTVIVETTRAIARQSKGTVSRHLIALELQKKADSLPNELRNARSILNNIANALDDRPVNPVVFELSKSSLGKNQP